MKRSARVFLFLAAASFGCGGAKQAAPAPPRSPVITSNGGGANATRSVAENGTAVTTVTATDVNPGTTFSYSINGGADAARFAINSSSGVLSFVSAPNFEAPTDAGANNVYDVTVQVSDGALTDAQAIAVTVTDVNEVPGTTTVNFSTYLGNQNHDFVRDVAVDSSGNVYAVGGAESSDLPTTNGTAQPNFGGVEDAFAVKFNAQGQILWSTFLGGASLDRAYAVELDAQNNVVIAGRAGAGFPVTPGVIQPQFQGGTPGTVYPAQDGFVAKLNGATGTLMWASYFGANVDQHIIRDIAIDRTSGFIYLAGSSDPGTFTPVVAAAFLRGHRSARFGGEDGVLAKLSGDGATLPWATFIGGSDDERGTASVLIDSQGNPVVLYSTLSTDAETTAGAFDRTSNGQSDWYVAKVSSNGPLIWASYVGGSAWEGTETHNLAIRGDDSVVIAASSGSSAASGTPFPVTAGAYDSTYNGTGGSGTGAATNYATDCAIAILAPGGGSLLAATFFGGSAGESCEGVGADSNSNVYVTGGSFSSLATTSGAYQQNKTANLAPFVAVFNRDLTALRYGSYFGGSGDSAGRSLVVHAEGRLVIGGEMGAGFPLRNPARSNVASGSAHGGVADLTVSLGPG